MNSKHCSTGHNMPHCCFCNSLCIAQGNQRARTQHPALPYSQRLASSMQQTAAQYSHRQVDIGCTKHPAATHSTTALHGPGCSTSGTDADNRFAPGSICSSSTAGPACQLLSCWASSNLHQITNQTQQNRQGSQPATPQGAGYLRSHAFQLQKPDDVTERCKL